MCRVLPFCLREIQNDVLNNGIHFITIYTDIKDLLNKQFTLLLGYLCKNSEEFISAFMFYQIINYKRRFYPLVDGVDDLKFFIIEIFVEGLCVCNNEKLPFVE